MHVVDDVDYRPLSELDLGHLLQHGPQLTLERPGVALKVAAVAQEEAEDAMHSLVQRRRVRPNERL